MIGKSLMGTLLFLPVVALATDYHCSQGNLERRIEIIYEPGRAVPCEVHYYKDSEAPGSHEVLWRAQNEAGYCEARTEELVARLQSYGWTCTAADDEEPAPEDDTESLAPPADLDTQD